MNQVASAHGPGLLFGMLQMPHLAPNTAAEDEIMLHAATAAAEPGSQADMAATAAAGSIPNSPEDALPEFAAAQLQHSHSGLATSTPEDALQQMKKVYRPFKGPSKKSKTGPGRRQVLVCKVDGCAVHLGGAKAYYQRHKVCAVHLSAMCASVNGVDSRFCQQCGKFQSLEEFDADKRSCRARLKRHNNRRREQRHSKNYEFALELHCHAAAQLLGERCEDPTMDPFMFPGVNAFHGQYGSPRCPPQYQQQQYSMPGGYGAPDSVQNLLYLGAAGAAYLGAGNPAEQQYQQQYLEPAVSQQQQQQPGLDMMEQWAAMECEGTVGGGPQHSTGNGMVLAGNSCGTFAGNSQHSSPGLTSHAAAMAATAAAAPAAAGIPASLQRVSASRALEALRALHASSYSTESDWDDAESEKLSRSPTWQAQRMGQGVVGQGSHRLQGSRLRDSRPAGSSNMMGYSGNSMPAHGGPVAAASLHVGHLGADLMDGSAQDAGQTGPGFSESAAHLNPGNSMQRYSQSGGGSVDMAYWEMSVAAQLQAQQQVIVQQAQAQWGASLDDALGAAASAACASYDTSLGHMQQQQQAGGLMAPAQVCSAPLQHQGSVSAMQHSAPAGLCYQSRTSSPAISTGGSHPAAIHNMGPGLSLLGPGGRKGAADTMHGRALQPQWSLPAQNTSAHEFDFQAAGSDGFAHGQQQCYLQEQVHHNSDPGHGTAALQDACAQQQGAGCAGMEFGAFPAQELQQVLQGLLAGTSGPPAQADVHMGGADLPSGGVGVVSGVQDAYGMCAQGMNGSHLSNTQHRSPQEVNGQVPLKASPGTPQVHAASCSQPGMNMTAVMARRHAMNMHGRTLSPQTSMTAVAAASAAAVARSGVAHGSAQMPATMLRALDAGLSMAAGAGAAGGSSVSRPPEASPGAVLSAVALGPGTYSIHPATVRPADSTGGSTALRDELAGVHLSSGSWEQQDQLHAGDHDTHMADPQCMQQQRVAGQHGIFVKQSDSPVVAATSADAAAVAGAPCADLNPASGEAESAEAAAAVFEAQLAACAGNKDSQEAVFKAWLEALMPDQQEQQHAAQQQQGLQETLRETLQENQHAQQGTADIDISNLEAATAAALQLAAQQAAGGAQGGVSDMNPEEDFKDLLDLLLDA